MIKTILFDLDGSLLPLNEEVFIKEYFGGLANHFASQYDKDKMMQAILSGTLAMINNDGKVTNKEAFWMTFSSLINGDYQKLEEEILNYYQSGFKTVKVATSPSSYASKIIRVLKEKNYQLVLATNPLFPTIATAERIKWAGLEEDDFDLITTYEDNYFCKPKIEYYLDILKRIGRKPEECLMVGNDVEEDMVVEEINMATYLLTECLINPKGKDIKLYNQGNLEDFYNLVQSWPSLVYITI